MYIDSCLTIAPLSASKKEQVLAIHSLLVPDTWQTAEEGRERVKVEVDLPGHQVKNTFSEVPDRDAHIMEEDEEDPHADPLAMKSDAKDSSKPKMEPYRCRYDSTCGVAFRSIKVINL